MEEHPPQNHILQVIEVLVELEFDVKTIFNPDLHFHLRRDLGFLRVVIVVHDCKVDLLGDGGFHVAVDDRPDEISDPTSDPIKCFVLLFEVGKFKFELSVFSEEACRFKLFGQ